MIKKIDPKATFKLVSMTDDAIDREKSDTKQYAETLDMAHLAFIEGASPTYFIIKNISARRQSELKKRHYVFVPPSKDAEGKEIPPRMEVKDQSALSLDYFEEAVTEVEEDGIRQPITLDQVGFIVAQEIGAYAMLHSMAPDSVKKTSK